MFVKKSISIEKSLKEKMRDMLHRDLFMLSLLVPHRVVSATFKQLSKKTCVI